MHKGSAMVLAKLDFILRLPPFSISQGSSPVLARILPVALLCCSNVFMTFAWYGHLKFKEKPLLIVIVVSWGIAFIEYCFAVPANRIGSSVYSGAELKAMQEVITLLVFAVFSVLYLGERLTISTILGFVLIAAGAFFVFKAPLPA
jgi:uncharacterized protein (DUF486 family)